MAGGSTGVSAGCEGWVAGFKKGSDRTTLAGGVREGATFTELDSILRSVQRLSHEQCLKSVESIRPFPVEVRDSCVGRGGGSLILVGG